MVPVATTPVAGAAVDQAEVDDEILAVAGFLAGAVVAGLAGVSLTRWGT
jgi:hypothetical protein